MDNVSLNLLVTWLIGLKEIESETGGGKMEVVDIIYDKNELQIKVIFDIMRPLGVITIQRVYKGKVIEEITLTSEEIRAVYSWIDQRRW